MRWNQILTTGMLAGTLAALPALSIAAPAPTCASVPTTNADHQAAKLLDNLEQDAHNVAEEADSMESMLNSTNVTWESHVYALNRVRADVNAMGDKLCRLESIRASATPWEQKAIDSAAPQLRLLADNTRDAIAFVNAHREDLWMPQYAKYIRNVSDESTNIAHSVLRLEEYARTHQREQELGRSVGIATGD